ncbi:hypothetical protein, partial [Leuconostoc sp.]
KKNYQFFNAIITNIIEIYLGIVLLNQKIARGLIISPIGSSSLNPAVSSTQPSRYFALNIAFFVIKKTSGDPLVTFHSPPLLATLNSK